MKSKKITACTILQSLRPYWAAASLYVVAILLIKVVELAISRPADTSWVNLLVRDIASNMIVVSWTMIVLAAVYGLISLASRKVAVGVVSALFALLTLSELGLSIYASHNGYLLGSELLARPIGETLMAVVGAAGIVLPIAGSVVILGGMTWLGIILSRRERHAAMFLMPVALFFVLFSLLVPNDKLLDGEHDSFILNKTHYLFVDGCQYLRSEKGEETGIRHEVAFDQQTLSYLRESHPEWKPLDEAYPLEREDNTPDFLSPYFAPSDRLPNIVMIVVESLGGELMGTGLMPFVDSLAAQGLYWRNCLSSTSRSYGAIPALTGSVGGPKSFQFGNMPDHNSLFAFLKSEGYRTQAFYAGDFTFDCIFEYLQAQHIDYLSPFYEECKSVSNNPDGNWWGYHDGVMFHRTIEELKRVSDKQPQFNLVTTLTMHENLELADRKTQQEFERRTAMVAKRRDLSFLKGRGAACAYTDECLRRFFADYRLRPDYGNTIFILTGDHATGLAKGNKLSFHHVPLIIVSPLLERGAVFNHRVTHNDVAPSIYRLLQGRYGMKPSPVHWIGRGLDPSPKSMVIVSYNHEMQEMVWGDFFYQTGNDWEPEMVYRIQGNLEMEPLSDKVSLEECRRQMQALRYLYGYTYYNNRLTQHPIYPRLGYATAVSYAPRGDVYCETPSEKPSEIGDKRYYLLPPTKLKGTQGYAMARVTLEADVLIIDSLWQDQYMKLAFSFDNGKEILEKDNISKFIGTERLRKDSLYHVELSKEFPLSGKQAEAAVFIQTASYDDVWAPGSRLAVKNRKITIDYGK